MYYMYDMNLIMMKRIYYENKMSIYINMGKYLDYSYESLKDIMYIIYIILKYKYLNAIIVSYYITHIRDDGAKL